MFTVRDEYGRVKMVSESSSFAMRVDDYSTPNVTYVGYADFGSLDSDPAWKIKKIDETIGAEITWADGNDRFDNVWNDRLTLIYL